jgi:hypothetical protein
MRAHRFIARTDLRPQPSAPAQQPKVVFRVFQNEHGRWCAASDDGMTGGTFFDRASAIHFARRESSAFPVLEGPRHARP